MNQDRGQTKDERNEAAEWNDAWFAMRLSLAFGVLMLAAKTAAYFVTGSSAILADAAESVVHVIAVLFAAFSLRLSMKPASPHYLYGYEKISFFSAGFEGGMIVLAAIFIIVTAVHDWVKGLQLENLGAGTLLIVAAALLNGALGLYLIRSGRRLKSIILEANGKHVLTDSLTSAGVIVALILVLVTGWKPFDPLVAILVALNILWAGGNLVWRSAQGLLDYSDPAIGREIQDGLDSVCKANGVIYHGLRFRTTGSKQLIEVHLLFPRETPLGEAHQRATRVEEQLTTELSVPAEVVTHLESLEDHEEVHSPRHHAASILDPMPPK